LAGDELRAEVVGVAADAELPAARAQERLDHGAQVGDPAVMPGAELVELPRRRDVLVLEGEGAAAPRGAEDLLADLVVDRAQLGARPGEETAEAAEALQDGGGARRPQGERLPRAGRAIEALGAHPLAGDRPQLVGEVLLDERDLRLHGQGDV